MGKPILILIFISLALQSIPSTFSSIPNTLTEGSSLSVENPNHVLISSNGVFSAGFHPVGENAYCFAIWFSETLSDGTRTVVWMANRDQPVNGRLSTLSLLKTGNLILTDAAQQNVWETNTNSLTSSTNLLLFNSGNLVLRNSESKEVIWQSFDSPTDTLLPLQPLTRNTRLVSSRSQTNYSSGFYKLLYDDNNILRLLYDGPEVSSIYWPAPWLDIWSAGRSSYNSSRIGVLNSMGLFESTDNLKFTASDFGKRIWRRLTMDADGNLRLYSLDEGKKAWSVSWQALPQSCRIHGLCGPNSFCSYVPLEKSKRRCDCIPGYKLKNKTDWSHGCEPDFTSLSCNRSESIFVHLPNVEFYGYDLKYLENSTFENCEKQCLDFCDCFGIQYRYATEKNTYLCYLKTLLLNGVRSTSYLGSAYVRLPKDLRFSNDKAVQKLSLDCSNTTSFPLDRAYKKPRENGTLQFMVWFACAFGGVEIICICFVYLFIYITRQNSGATTQGYIQVAAGFRKFTYDELKKATQNFCNEIGRGGGGVVFKGILSDQRVAAIKRLNEVSQAGEAEFLAEVSSIGKLNHMNLIEMWGYCAEGKHRLLIYEYMEHGSLAENLSSNTIDSEKRFEIAVGTAKGLAYLHEECLEWVLHCDVKPENILLDSNYHPKVADFGLSKLLNRGDVNNSSFSRIRGTRGYMAPEWIFNLPITSKVDVYSYGVVLLELITGKRPTMGPQGSGNAGKIEQRGLVNWVRQKMSGNGLGLEEIIDPVMKDQYDESKMEILVGVALQCVEEDKDARPTMSQVIQMLVQPENESIGKSIH